MSNNQAMNHDLIKQLELAIQVERGEVPSGEIEHRRKIPLVVSEWIHTGIPVWNFRVFEYRRKPKPLELWVNIREDGLMRCFDCIQNALADAKSRASNDEMPERSVAVHMREVTNE